MILKNPLKWHCGEICGESLHFASTPFINKRDSKQKPNRLTDKEIKDLKRESIEDIRNFRKAANLWVKVCGFSILLKMEMIRVLLNAKPNGA